MLLSLIQKHKKISRSQLAKITKISNTSVGKIVKELMEDELVIEVGQIEGEVGRRAILLEINSKGSYIIGVNLEISIIQIAIVSLNGEIVMKEQLEYDVLEKAEVVLNFIASAINNILKLAGSEYEKKVIAIGVSVPGLVSWPEGKTLMVPQLHWKNINVKSLLEEKLDYVVYVDNDVRTVLLAESLFGSMTDFTNATCIHVGSGLGSAVMINGEILRGHSNTLGEIGHITLVPDGALCNCGRMGCLQTYICSSELEKQSGRHIQDIFNAFEHKEEWAVKLINRARSYLGMVISNVVCMYNPEAVLLSGQMIQDYPVLIKDIEAISNTYVLAPLRNSFQLKESIIGTDSGVIGASALVLNEFLRYSNDDI